MIVKNATEKLILFRLFIVAYAPLAVITAVQTCNAWNTGETRTYVFWITVLWSALGFLEGYRLPRGALRKGSIKATVHDIHDQSGATAAYLATYILPFIGIDFTIPETISLLFFIIVVFAIFVGSNLVAVNPTIYIFRWRVIRALVTYPCSIHPMPVVLIHKKEQLLPNETVDVVELGKVLVMKEV